MTAITHIKAKIAPWDDTAFVRAFEHARDEAARDGYDDGPRGAGRVERLLRAAGYPTATVAVARTAQEALEHIAHWIVRRDG